MARGGPSPRPRPRLDALFGAERAVLLDGACGTELLARGWPAEQPTTLANLHAPGLVAELHAAHRRAGARVLLANTFGALAVPADRRAAAVGAGVRIARKAAGDRARVAGVLAGHGLAGEEAALDELVDVLLLEGAELLVFETITRIEDARAALQAAARRAPRLPVVLCATTTDGSSTDRHAVESVLALAVAEGATAGLNCCRGPHETFKLALALPVLPAWIKPSTGAPADPVDDNVMAAFARAAVQRGVRWVGGCCGTSPETLQLMSAAVENSLP